MIEFVQNRILSSKIIQLFTRTLIKWQQDDCIEMGAALSYYAIFSLFPILLVILSITGLILGPDTNAYTQILIFAKTALPIEAYRIVESTLLQLNTSSLGAGIIGFSILFITASRIFLALSRDVDKIWKVYHRQYSQNGWFWTIINFIKNQIIAFLLVLSSTALMLVSLLSNIALKVFVKTIINVEEAITWVRLDEAFLWNSLQLGVTYFLLTSVIMFLYKTLPGTKVKWSDIWIGSLLAVSLFFLLQSLVSKEVIRIGEQFRAYGIIGGFMVLLLWIFLNCQIFLLGCEFTYVYTHLFGSRKDK
ncbi:YihY/virulence factor BrkB family protein [Crocosphaera sp.]|uniref:YihY/virulence factor BrkB family protein n=1 Tax=Crocosphaera sp. TaxID=2729996 RepID=UPI002614ADBE|nr:YihY/virulence factor BrkB family protein [Crocosphaera sp.]MDJ0582764.1 YihY/virulence factor BrkB family protein [Crocosphaera sp.]